MKYYIKTYGCQMNHSDSERIASVLEAAEYEKVLLEDKADLIVINMCSVRKSAVDRVAGNFKRYKKYKKKNQNLKIVLTGCVLESDRERFEKLFDLVVDIKDMNSWLHSSHRSGAVEPKYKSFANRFHSPTGLWSQQSYFKIKPNYKSKFSAYVPIMTGCNNFCSYCVVPYTRGREYSRPVEEILDEIAKLVKKGYKEIILLGQNVNSYQLNCESKIINQKLLATDNLAIGQFDNKTIDFPNLLKLINNIPGDFWIRFLTSHPKDMTEKLIKTVAECEKVTPYIHLAFQSGDNEILKKMNRKYTAEHFLDLVKIIRKYIPNVAITTDVIVGFPTETEEQFQKTAGVMKKAKFDMVYINKYSPRVGTVSAKLEDNVSWKEKKKRENILTGILKRTALENNQKYIGKIQEILIDKIDGNFIYGKTKSFKSVRIELKIKNISDSASGQELKIKEGKFLKIKITQASAWGLKGKIK
ncbi:MAG: tRNA (N6-isopentenyl adenosine(37)-C2)-methylthiotransferase MiaB [Patescibacteria group bacterium]|nr:tRNA (N6-isopentenyl adenosine(37)-C2)-methylthiotransferase MiaB [Patescibacteria group bacterium]